MKKVVRLGLLILLACALTVSSFAQEASKEEREKKMQEAWAKASTPGEHHKHLAAYAGSWTYTSKMWMDPSAPAEESQGTCERTMILDGRFLREEWSGNFQGMPFKGITIYGYDNLAGSYKSVWIDNMSTAMMTGTGECNSEEKSLSLQLEYIDAMTGKKAIMRSVAKWIGDNEQLLEYFGPAPDGTEYKAMEFTLIRK